MFPFRSSRCDDLLEPPQSGSVPVGGVPAGAVGDGGLGEFEGGGELVEVGVTDRAGAGADLVGEQAELGDPAGPGVTTTTNLRLYRVSVTAGTVSLAAPVANSQADWSPASRVLITSPGDTDGDGIPDYYSIYNTGTDQLWANRGTTLSPTSFTVANHNLVDDGSTHDWTDITNLA